MTQNNSQGKNISLDISGDLNGNINNVNVIKIQNNSISSSAPTDGYVLTWNSSLSHWEGDSQPATTISTLANTIRTTKFFSSITYSVVSGDFLIVQSMYPSGVLTITALFPNSFEIGGIITITCSILSSFSHGVNCTPQSGSVIYGLSFIPNQSWATFICFDGKNWGRLGYP